jgi:hypothetical protein
VKQWIGQNRLDDGRVPGEPAQVHSHSKGEPGRYSGEYPAHGHKHGRYAELAEGRGRGDDAGQAIRIVQGVLENDQSSKAVAQDEERQVGLPASDAIQEAAKIFAVLIPAPDVRPLAG